MLIIYNTNTKEIVTILYGPNKTPSLEDFPGLSLDENCATLEKPNNLTVVENPNLYIVESGEVVLAPKYYIYLYKMINGSEIELSTPEELDMGNALTLRVKFKTDNDVDFYPNGEVSLKNDGGVLSQKKWILSGTLNFLDTIFTAPAENKTIRLSISQRAFNALRTTAKTPLATIEII
jgi:hypothetical protein